MWVYLNQFRQNLLISFKFLTFYEATFLCRGGHHIDVETICFGPLESSQRKISMPRLTKMLIYGKGYDISYFCVRGFLTYKPSFIQIGPKAAKFVFWGGLEE